MLIYEKQLNKTISFKFLHTRMQGWFGQKEMLFIAYFFIAHVKKKICNKEFEQFFIKHILLRNQIDWEQARLM